ncbi:hypothetical protein LSO07_11500 [Janthinobacterium sp. PLB04]|uniref:Ribosomal protein S3AE n=1 Tax=Janthinobacterium lividum TaxID=29581 RepID=A0AAJ4MX42_9BURK|nr:MULTISPECIES: hypothetical protein [Janthinobacterium]KAB0324381.1 hypothetical protein F3B38_11555 [Janthinobacterium lividum]QSX98482.1 hypothetical protein J3P46_11655 [Janthinobacterium lividum]UGQ38442.1 hypothetical protein LSO07_11500 [Janthinobacterium sp. PLB04]
MRIVDFEVRKECPPQLCDCERERLLDDAQADLAILRLNLTEEKRLLAHIEGIATHAQLQKLQLLLKSNLGVDLQIAPGSGEVRTVRGFQIRLLERPGLCRKTRAAIPAAVRRCLAAHPEIAFAILNENDLLGGV